MAGGLDTLAVAAGKGDVGAADHRAAAGLDPEVGLGTVLGLLAEASGRTAELHRQAHPERRQRRRVERPAALVVAGLESDVVERGRQPSAATIGE